MDDAKRREKLSVQDLMGLFGDVGEEGGKPFIFAESADREDQYLRLANVDEEDEEQFMGNEE